jgi:beta-alanine--pyruvate transaminase
LDLIEREGAIERYAEVGRWLAEGVHSLKGEPNVIDIRNISAAAAFDLVPLPGTPGLRAIRLFEEALKHGLLVRFTADTIALAPPSISTETEIQKLVEGMRACIRAVA